MQMTCHNPQLKQSHDTLACQSFCSSSVAQDINGIRVEHCLYVVALQEGHATQFDLSNATANRSKALNGHAHLNHGVS